MFAKLKGLLGKLIAVRAASTSGYFYVLDGWRGLSILFVLAAHLLPLGPKYLRLNEMAGPLGMCLFFTLSGFLIANFLIHKPNVYHFIVRRFFRIIPLAWLYLIIALPVLGADENTYLAHFFFFGNWTALSGSQVWVATGTSHFWSLCVEMQFYIVIAFLFFLFKQRALLIIPFTCLGITAFRVYEGVYIATNTYFRIDEILVGVIVALAYNKKIGEWLPREFSHTSPYLVLILLLISCHPEGGMMNYFRPYLAATLVAITLYRPNLFLVKVLHLRVLVYLASISYALYIIHPLLAHTWLGSGDVIEKYAKRPLLFSILFVLAHLSTFYYEKYWVTLAKRITTKK